MLLKSKKRLPFLSSLLIFLAFQIVLILPQALYLSLIILVVIFFSVLFISDYSYHQFKFWLFFFTPGLLFAGGFIYLYFLETESIRQVLIIGLSLYNWFILKRYYDYFKDKEGESQALINIINYTSLVITFFFFSNFFALRIFMNMKLIWLELFVFLISLLLVIQNFWLQKISLKKNYLHLLVIVFSLLEVFWTAIYLPTHFLVNGVFLAIIFYLLLNFSRLSIQESLERKILIRYLSLGISAIILVFLTAQWV